MRIDNNTNRKLAPLLSFIIPGAGHLALGFHLKGLMLLIGSLADVMAMIRYADDSGGKFALLIVFLGLALPSFWFYSVFDTLQQSARLRFAEVNGHEPAQQPQASAWVQGIVVLAVALILLALVRAPSMLTPWVDTAGTYAPGTILIAIAFLLAAGRGKAMFRMGRMTAAMLIVAVGGLLLWDQIRGRNDIQLLGQWWPAAFVLLGIEVVVYSLVYRGGGKRLNFDIGGSLLAVIVAVTAFAVTQYSTMPFSWLDNFKANIANMEGFGEEKGFKYEMETVTAPVPPDLSSLVIDNVNGNVTVKKGDVTELTVETVLWVDTTDKQEADNVRKESKVEVSGGEKLKIGTKGQPYGANGSRKPRINMIVTVPESSHLGTPPSVQNDAFSGKMFETSNELNSSNTVDVIVSDPQSDAAAVNPADGEQTGFDAASSPAPDKDAASSIDAGIDELTPPSPNEEDIPAADGSEIANSGLPNGANGADVVDEAALEGGNLQNTPDNGADNGSGGSVGNEENQNNSEGDTVKAEMSIEVTNGDIQVDGLIIPGGLKIKLTDGEIKVGGTTGPIDAQTKNGGIDVSDIEGSVQLQASNGDVKAQRINGDVDGSTLSGNIQLGHISGHTEVETKNGGIDIREVGNSVKADTLNGDIVIHSATVGGNWDIDSSIGEIGLFLPETGDYSIYGSVTFGNVSTDLPLTATKKTISGDIGAATYRINIDANSSIAVNRYTP